MDILKSVEPVLEQSTYVEVDKDKIRDFAGSFDRNRLTHWLSISPYDLNQLNEEKKVSFLFVLNSISFSYWGEPKWQIGYSGKTYDGAQAMMACLGKAIEDNEPILKPNYLRNISKDDLVQILQGNTEIPLLNNRLKNLRELGAVTQRDFRGDFRHFIDRSQGDPVQLVDLLVENFPSFEDSSVYRGRKVYFNKRAQLLAADLSYSLGLDNIEKLTACADYKLPQILRRYGILKYSDKLQRKIRAREEIPAGSQEEVEIRANTIHAVELIKKEISGINSNQINDYLWLEGQMKLPTDEPYHLTRTTAY